MARQLYAKMLYLSNTNFILIIQNNHTKSCDVTIGDIDVAQQIWGKDIDALKVKTIQTKPNPAAGEMIKIPKELHKLNKKVFLTVDLFSVNRIPLIYITQPQD